MTTRRNFLRSAAGLLIAAPMVVRAENIMRVRPEHLTLLKGEFGIIEGFRFITSPRMVSPGVTVHEIDHSEFIPKGLHRSDPVVLCEGKSPSMTWRLTSFGPVQYADDRNKLLDLIPENYTQRFFNALRGK